MFLDDALSLSLCLWSTKNGNCLYLNNWTVRKPGACSKAFNMAASHEQIAPLFDKDADKDSDQIQRSPQ